METLVVWQEILYQSEVIKAVEKVMDDEA